MEFGKYFVGGLKRYIKLQNSKIPNIIKIVQIFQTFAEE